MSKISGELRINYVSAPEAGEWLDQAQPAGTFDHELEKELTLFYKVDGAGYAQLLPGIKSKTLVFGDRTLFSEFRMEANSLLPKHSHVHEQTGYLVRGRIRLTIGVETFEAGPGDSWCIPGNVEHSAEILEDSLAIEVFSPVREDYLPKKEAG